MFYINEKGIVIEAIKWDGSEEGAQKIAKNFKVVALRHAIEPKVVTLRDKGEYQCDIVTGDYIFKDLLGKVIYRPAREFEPIFKPITDQRVQLVEEIKKTMLLKLEQRENKGDWLEQSFEALFLGLFSECHELQEAVGDIQNANINKKKLNALFDAAKKEAADVINYAAMIHDKIDKMEIDEMWKNIEEGKNSEFARMYS